MNKDTEKRKKKISHQKKIKVKILLKNLACLQRLRTLKAIFSILILSEAWKGTWCFLLIIRPPNMSI